MNVQQKTQSVAAYVRELAAHHKIVGQRSKLDDWADAVTRLAGDDVELDEVERLIVQLGRANILSGRETVSLAARYLREK
jgi:hypothetical protein